MWEGYSKEEASWVPAKDITEIAIRSVLLSAASITKVRHFTDVHYRFYHEPQPQERTILDAISSFSIAIHGSLRVGLLAKRSLTIEFPRQVFTFLFKDKGTNVQGKPGKLYERSDFLCHYFTDSHFSYYTKDGNGCFVSFPIYMYSHVKFSQQCFDSDGKKLPRSFTETLFVKLLKSYTAEQ